MYAKHYLLDREGKYDHHHRQTSRRAEIFPYRAYHEMVIDCEVLRDNIALAQDSRMADREKNNYYLVPAHKDTSSIIPQ